MQAAVEDSKDPVGTCLNLVNHSQSFAQPQRGRDESANVLQPASVQPGQTPLDDRTRGATKKRPRDELKDLGYQDTEQSPRKPAKLESAGRNSNAPAPNCSDDLGSLTGGSGSMVTVPPHLTSGLHPDG